MKFNKRSGNYKASNVTFNPKTKQAYSYNWWRFVDVVNGKVVFNNFSYSNTTCKHQHKVRRVLRELGISIDLEVSCPAGLQNLECGIHALKAAYRAQNFELVKKVKQTFKVSLTQLEIEMLYIDMEENLCDTYLHNAIKYQEKQESNKPELWNKQLNHIIKVG